MTTNAQTQREFELSFLADPFFAESIVYGQNGVEKTISAVVVRNKMRSFNRKARSETVQQNVYAIEIEISNGATNGIASINERADYAKVPVVYGSATLTKFQVSAITGQGNGTWRLGLSG